VVIYVTVITIAATVATKPTVLRARIRPCSNVSPQVVALDRDIYVTLTTTAATTATNRTARRVLA